METAIIEFDTMWKHIESLERFDNIEKKSKILEMYITSKELQLEKESC